MFGLGHIELLILIVFFVSIWLIVKLVRNVSSIEAWVTKRSEARFLAIPGTGKIAHREHPKLWWLPLPFALIAVVASYFISTALAVIAIMSQGYLPSWVVSTINVLTSGVAVGSIIIGLLIHFSPGGNRKVKYEFLVAGTSILSIGFLYFIAQIISYAVQPPVQWWMTPRPGLDPGVARWAVITHIVFLLTVQIVFSLWVGQSSTDRKNPSPSSTMRRNFGLVRRAGYVFALFSFSGMTQPLLTAYLILRYILGEQMSQAPILYLRSFHYVEGPTAFGKIVARVASRYGVLLALVHQTQRPLALHAETRLTERAELAKAPDGTWRKWIEEQMATASVIIIDYSVDTKGLSWELDRAVSIVDPSKILLLNQKGVVIRTPKNVWNLEYEIGPEGEGLARRKLNEQLRTVLLAS